MPSIALVTNNPSYEAVFRNKLINWNGIIERVAPEILAGIDFPEYDAYVIHYDDGFSNLDKNIPKIQFVTKNKYGKRVAIIVVADNITPPQPLMAMFNETWVPVLRTSDLTPELLQAIPLLRFYDPQVKVSKRFYEEQEILAKQYHTADLLDKLAKVCWIILVLGVARLVFLL